LAQVLSPVLAPVLAAGDAKEPPAMITPVLTPRLLAQ
jgi:hypothetical protein